MVTYHFTGGVGCSQNLHTPSQSAYSLQYIYLYYSETLFPYTKYNMLSLVKHTVYRHSLLLYTGEEADVVSGLTDMDSSSMETALQAREHISNLMERSDKER